MDDSFVVSDFTVATPAFAFTPEVERAAAPLWEKLKTRVTPLEWRLQAPLIQAINELKREKNAVILAHNYMTAMLCSVQA